MNTFNQPDPDELIPEDFGNKRMRKVAELYGVKVALGIMSLFRGETITFQNDYKRCYHGYILRKYGEKTAKELQRITGYTISSIMKIVNKKNNRKIN